MVSRQTWKQEERNSPTNRHGVARRNEDTVTVGANGQTSELQELMGAVKKIVDRGIVQTSTLTVVKRRIAETVGKVSENEKGLTVRNC